MQFWFDELDEDSQNERPVYSRYYPTHMLHDRCRVYHPIYGSKLRTARKQRLRTTYPMDWDLDSAKRLVTSKKQRTRQQQIQTNQTLAQSRVFSGFNKQLFDHTLNDFYTNSACQREPVLPKLKKERPKTTGPTRHGSPIYNRRAGLLTNIRLQTVRRQLPLDISNLPLSIEENIASYSERFKVVLDDASGSAQLVQRPELRIIRQISNISIIHDKPEGVDKPQEGVDKPQEGVDKPQEEADKPQEGVDDLKTEPTLGLDEQPESGAEISSTLQRLESRNGFAEEEETGDGEKVPELSSPVLQDEGDKCGEEITAEIKLTEVMRRDDSAQLDKPKKKVRVESGDSKTSLRSSKTSLSDVSMTPRPRTWVDDLSSICSSKQELMDEELVDSLQSPVKPTEVAAEPEVVVLPEPPRKNSLEKEVDENPDVEDDPAVELPAFICPSSEGKSREYALRQWLAQTDFHRAIKTVPLI